MYTHTHTKMERDRASKQKWQANDVPALHVITPGIDIVIPMQTNKNAKRERGEQKHKRRKKMIIKTKRSNKIHCENVIGGKSQMRLNISHNSVQSS